MSAYAQFGYGYSSPASQLLVSGQPASSVSPPAGAGASGGGSSGVSTGAVSPSGSASGAGSCCENGRPIMTDPVSGQTVCSCQYDSARLALSSYPRAAVYGAPYPSTDQNPYPSIDSSAFYSPLSNPYGLKEGGTTADMTAWTGAGLQPSAGYYPYDPALAAYGYGAGYDLAARRKNATRESTATLKAWLNEHKKNPYPTKGEKIMLAIITKMTLTQVSTWFANARRRLKKENKMTWEPRNRVEDEDNNNDEVPGGRKSADNKDNLDSKDSGTGESEDGDRERSHQLLDRPPSSEYSGSRPGSPECLPHFLHPAYHSSLPLPPGPGSSQPPKTKIWSLADMASKGEPDRGRLVSPLARGGLHPLHHPSYPHDFYRSFYPHLPGAPGSDAALLDSYSRSFAAAGSTGSLSSVAAVVAAAAAASSGAGNATTPFGLAVTTGASSASSSGSSTSDHAPGKTPDATQRA